MKKNFFLAFLILLSFNCYCQIVPDSLTVVIDGIDNVKIIKQHTYLFIDSSQSIGDNDIAAQNFVPLMSVDKWKYVPDRLITKNFYLAFKLKNPDREDLTFEYYPGSLYSALQLFKVENGTIKNLGSFLNNAGLIKIKLTAGETSLFIVKGSFSRSDFNQLTSNIVAENFSAFYRMEIDRNFISKKVVGLLLSGALFMMILFTIVNYIISRKPEFFYNCIYCICMFLLIFFTTYLSKDGGNFKIFFRSYLDLFLLMTGTIFYLIFTRTFLNTKIIFPGLDKFLLIEQWLIVAMMLIFTWLHFGTDNFIWERKMENIMKLIVLAAGIVFVVLAFIKRNILMNYLAAGIAIQIFFYSVSLFLIFSKINTDYIFTAPIFYFVIGVVFSVFFFLLGLTYKNKMELIGRIKEQEAMKMEVEKKGFETRIAVIKAQQEERNRISSEMHDDLGAGMTAIRLYSELAKNKVSHAIIPEIEKISASANELLNKMNAIIWSMSSSNDSFGNMVAYIRIYALEYLEESNITANIVIPDNLPDIEVSGQIRRNVFLVVKEALHNVVKHANATEVDIILSRDENSYTLIIKDNGKGIDLDNIRAFGNGLKNMKKRMDAVNMDFEIYNDNGTVVKLVRMIPQLFPPEKGNE